MGQPFPRREDDVSSQLPVTNGSLPTGMEVLDVQDCVPGLGQETSVPVDVQNPQLPKEPLYEALNLLRAALQLLDDAQAPGPLGAQVDLAICRLEDFLGVGEA